MVFAGLFHLYRHGLNEAKKEPVTPPQAETESPKPLDSKE
jgi:ubiquinol-cytochrome c reductase cytochrome b subunit